ncbi:alpha-1,2-fucosyltransferase [Acidicapsa dinghuensis]|uniref:Alpha-1,2-fucosyltransferase n=1 Tax=Acidicapsa dinghuensis TaxID=2218256 RepID=A0ABW1EIZ8_9BACT|nr:alpha-1,2-fucosyltransferase [Acidicapsa dinghuensis]
MTVRRPGQNRHQIRQNKMQIILRQISGLGNQLFQYAAGRYFAKRENASLHVAVDLRGSVSHGYARPFLLSNFSIQSHSRTLNWLDRLMLSERTSRINEILKRALGVQVVKEEFSHRYDFQPELRIEKGTKIAYLAGYWQSYHYAMQVEKELRSEFEFRVPMTGKNAEISDRIQRANWPISLHIRRGDYTLAAEGNIALPLSYYHRSMNFFRSQLNSPTFFVFSDDMKFARKHLSDDNNIEFVDHNSDATAHEDLRLMSMCRHHVIANSTFSWWGAWLNRRHDKIVVAPKYWHLTSSSYHPDLFPPDWILLDHSEVSEISVPVRVREQASGL